MSKNRILIFFAIIIIFIVIICFKSQKSKTVNNMETVNNQDSKVKINKTKDGYEIYDVNTGMKITDLDFEDEYKIKLYELDPKYQEVDNGKSEIVLEN